MPLSESGSRLAVSVWAALWLPGFFLACWRAEQLLRASRVSRATLELLALVSAPLLAFGLYSFSDAQRYAQAHNAQVSWGTFAAVLLIALPHAVGAAYLLLVLRRQVPTPTGSRWWVAALLGLLAVVIFAPGLLMAQLMVLAGS
jgi:hypothetical protein